MENSNKNNKKKKREDDKIMKLEMIKHAITRTAGRGGLIVKKYSPEILLAAGVVGIVTTTVMACKATLKVDEVLQDANADLEKIERVRLRGDVEKYSDEDAKNDSKTVKIQTAGRIVKLYGPAVTLGLVSLGCILGAHGIMRKRNLALAAAYKVVEKSFADYRRRVVEELGEEKDRQFKYGIKKEKITQLEVNDKGKTVAVEKIVNVVDTSNISQYARFFDEYNVNWSKTPEYNMLFLKCAQATANDKLHSKGHIFLNEVYELLGLDHSQEGAVVGWVDGNGDDFVDFGLYDGEDVSKRLFVNGDERSVLLDFNVDGIIFDKI